MVNQGERPRTVVIVGGGLAGLAAAARLVQAGFRVTVLESRPRLGGRASSFGDVETGALVDNCQHVSLGCCTAFQDLCETTGLSRFFVTERTLNFVGPAGEVRRIRNAWLPAPFHLVPAIARLPWLGWGDLARLGRAMRALTARSVDEERPFEAWLREQGQTQRLIDRVWHPVLVSALSERLDRIRVGAARHVFRDAFLRRRNGWHFQVPTVPLGELYGVHLAGWLRSRGAAIHMGRGADSLLWDGQRVCGVRLRQGEVLAADDVILAVTHRQVRRLLPEELERRLPVDDWEKLETAPITSVHLWFDRRVTGLRHAVFLERLTQWMFHRSLLVPGSPEGMVQVVISDSRGVADRPQAEIVARVCADLAVMAPAVRDAQLEHARVVTEHHAVFSPLPGSERLRPLQATGIPGLTLAGDWTQTGWPATMEGAVRSGNLAAAQVAAAVARPRGESPAVGCRV